MTVESIVSVRLSVSGHCAILCSHLMAFASFWLRRQGAGEGVARLDIEENYERQGEGGGKVVSIRKKQSRSCDDSLQDELKVNEIG